jgi:hypothetical protein
MYIIAAIALPEAGGLDCGVEAGGCVLRMAPTMKNKVPIPRAEMNSDGLRPHVSTKKNIKIAVAMTLTTP